MLTGQRWEEEAPPALHLLLSWVRGAAPLMMGPFIWAPVAFTPAARCAASSSAAAPATKPADCEVPSCMPYCTRT